MSSNTTNDYSQYILRINTISNQISFYYLIIIIPFGLVTNCISIFIYLRPSLNRKTNTGFLYMCLSIMNIISLLNYAFIVRSNNLFGYTVTITCGVANYIRRNIFNATSWIQALISFDRFMLTYYPSKSKFMSKKTTILSLILLIMIVILIANTSNLISYQEVKLQFNNKTNITTVTETCVQTDQMSLMTDFLAILMRLYIPFIIMVILNFLVVRRLHQSKEKVKKFGINSILLNKGIKIFSKKEYKFTIATITMDVLFWIFYTPVSINLTLNIVNTFNNFLDSPISTVNYRLYSNVSQLMAFTYHSIIIFFYLGFNSYFRAEILSFLNFYKIRPIQISALSNSVRS